MISREYAEKLKAVGVVGIISRNYYDCTVPGEVLFLPRLDQLLAMIEQEGYTADVDTVYYCFDKDGYDCELHQRVGDEIKTVGHFTAPTRGDACALALIWIKGDKE